MAKLSSYLWRSDFEEYFRHPNQTGEEEFVREKLLESDFPAGFLDVPNVECALCIIMFLGLFKLAFFVAGNLKLHIFYVRTLRLDYYSNH